jgi:hypothetical protein
MTGFFVLDVPEFASLIAAAQRAASCVVHPLAGGYRFVEFDNEIEIRRSDTQMNEAVWFGCLTAGLIGKIARFDKDILKLVATNEPIVM